MDYRVITGYDYQYSGETLDEPTCVWVIDHHYDEFLHQYPIKKLLQNSTVDPSQHLLIFDDFLRCDDFSDYQTLCFPGRTASQEKVFLETITEIDWDHKTVIFNFMANKPRTNRILLAKLISYLGLQDFVYTMTFPRDSKFFILSPTVLQPLLENIQRCLAPLSRRFVDPDKHLLFNDTYVEIPKDTNAGVYEHYLKKNIFEISFVSLITEPLFEEQETMITEKTLMAFYGGTFPIWVGGWGIPDALKKIGYDIFEDIIDHSYQWHPDPFARCLLSVQNNLDLLKNKSRVETLWHNNRKRLEHNLYLCRSSNLQKYCSTLLMSQGSEKNAFFKKIIGESAMLNLLSNWYDVSAN